ncbi:MAG: MATE family efflux transporter [Clostridia bacterium]|nr:MATE family efflux transporter [Clostridia bacterium]
MEEELTQEQKQFNRMTKTPICPLIMKLALPTTISMLVTSVYNLADTFFVSQIDTSASGAVSVVFSLMAIIQAIGFTLGMGGGSIISRSLGAKNQKKASEVFSTAFFSALALGVIIAVLGIAFSEPLMNFLGAVPSVLPYAQAYSKYILFGAPIMMGSYVLNNVWRAEGKAVFSMIALGLGGIINIFLDPVFIYKLDLGISGAAIATLISQLVSFILLFIPVLQHKNVSSLGFKYFSRNLSLNADIWLTGLPSLLRQGLSSISTILLNKVAGAIAGAAALSAMGIFSKIFMMIFCVGLGIGQGYQPVLGYNYGARKLKRVRQAFIFTFVFSTGIMVAFGLALYIFAPDIMPLFISDPEVIDIGTYALRFEALVMPLLPINVMCNMTFQSLGHRFKASFLSCLRQGLFFIPCIYVLSNFWGIRGIEAVQPISDILTFIVSIPFAIVFLRKLSKETEA